MKECKLLEQLKEIGCKLFEANVSSYELKDSSIVFNDIQEYITFIKYNDIKSIFYNYQYYEKEEYIINGHEVDEYIIKSVSKAIKERNSLINSLDFINTPRKLCVYALYQGKYVSYYFYNNWLEEMDIEKSSSFVEKLEYQYSEVLEKRRKEHCGEVLSLKNELKEIILNDFTFTICRSKELRTNYADNIRRDRKYKKYECCFAGGYKKGIYKTDFDFFIELTWAEYKKLKEKK